jgi:hypothetical protein
VRGWARQRARSQHCNPGRFTGLLPSRRGRALRLATFRKMVDWWEISRQAPCSPARLSNLAPKLVRFLSIFLILNCWRLDWQEISRRGFQSPCKVDRILSKSPGKRFSSVATLSWITLFCDVYTGLYSNAWCKQCFSHRVIRMLYMYKKVLTKIRKISMLHLFILSFAPKLAAR